jgi:hypothetical protein
MVEQALLAHHVYAVGIPLVACALYKAAAAGEVVISVPAAESACWSCAVGAVPKPTSTGPNATTVWVGAWQARPPLDRQFTR